MSSVARMPFMELSYFVSVTSLIYTYSVCLVIFLAHLSRRLTGELIVYPSVRRGRSQFQRSSSLKPLGQSN